MKTLISVFLALFLSVALRAGVPVTFYANSAAAGATTVETAITLTMSRSTAATTTGVSFVIPANKKYVIKSIMVATMGNAVATAQNTVFNLRVNTAGAVTTSSTPVIFSTTSATPATASAWDRICYTLGDSFTISGDGTIQLGITAKATYTTNAPTWFVTIIAEEQ